MDMNELRVGDYVRSYDFPGMRDDCFVEGELLSIDDRLPYCPVYHIDAVRTVSEGRDVAAPRREVMSTGRGIFNDNDNGPLGVVKIVDRSALAA
jgi:hypothetical protein